MFRGGNFRWMPAALRGVPEIILGKSCAIIRRGLRAFYDAGALRNNDLCLLASIIRRMDLELRNDAVFQKVP